MQHPVGYAIRNGRAELVDFVAVVTQKYAVLTILHTLGAAYILSGFFVMGVSAYHLLRGRHTGLFTKSFRMALAFALIFSVFEMAEGHLHGADLAETQPTKLAAMEALWETESAAPMHLFLIPDPENERNLAELFSIPGALSLLARHSVKAEVKGLKEFPREERPPVVISFLSFRAMVGLGTLFVLLTVVGWFKRDRLTSSPGYLKIMLYAIPLPYIANAMGWTLAEVGRQPWIVYGLMKTSDAVSPIAPSQVGLSLAAFIVVYSLLGIAAFILMAKQVKKGPEPSSSTAM